MTMPGWYALVVLGLGIFRLCRLIGWDDITVGVRTRYVGLSDQAHSQWTYALGALEKIDRDPWDYGVGAMEADAFGFDVGRGLGITSGTITLPPLVGERLDFVRMASSHPVAPTDVTLTIMSPDARLVPFSRERWYVSKMIRCPWCVGFWLTLVVWSCWQVAPRGTLVVMSLLALSALPGLITKNLDR